MSTHGQHKEPKLQNWKKPQNMSNSDNLSHWLPIASANRRVMNALKNTKPCCHHIWKTDTKETLHLLCNKTREVRQPLAERTRRGRTAHFQQKPGDRTATRTRESHELQFITNLGQRTQNLSNDLSEAFSPRSACDFQVI